MLLYEISVSLSHALPQTLALPASERYIYIPSPLRAGMGREFGAQMDEQRGNARARLLWVAGCVGNLWVGYWNICLGEPLKMLQSLKQGTYMEERTLFNIYQCQN